MEVSRMSNRISFEVNNNGLMTFEQEQHDGHVDAIVWDVIAQDESGVIRRGVRHGYEISAGDMVLLFDHYAQCRNTGAPIVNEYEPRTINDMRALLKMLRTDVLPEPARSLAEKLRREI
jgi:hypothetical protein